MHLGSQSFGKVSGIRAKAIEKNKKLFEQKWGKSNKTLLASTDYDTILKRARNKEKIYLAALKEIFKRFEKAPHQNVVKTHQIIGIDWLDKLIFPYHSSYLGRKKRIDRSSWEIG